MSIFSIFTGNSKPFSGKTVAFTGTLRSGTRTMTRAEAKRIVKENGGDVVIGEYGRVRNANLLVLGDRAKNYGNTASQKADEAKERGIATITAEQFFQMIG